MLGLTIKRLKVCAVTRDGDFFTEITFDKGLNIIRAENSSGKSTCINAIAYAFGLEAILGPSRRKPFPRSLYQMLETSKSDSSEHVVLRSYIELDVENSNEQKVMLIRDVEGLNEKVIVHDFTSGLKEDYFLGSSGSVGSAKSRKGFHFWLESFIDWKLPSVTTYEGKPIKLYLECIFPLFFIEQKRGWSEIQANTPTYYGIKGVKKAAIEYCMGLEDYSKRNKVVELSKALDDLKVDWEKVKTSAASLAEFGNLRLELNSNLEKDSFFPLVNFFVSHEDSQSHISDYISGIKVKLNQLKSNTNEWPLNKEREELHARFRATSRKIEVSVAKEESLRVSISGLNKKIETIDFDLDRYKQLRRLRTVGGETGISTEIKNCPICESEMYDSLIKITSGAKPLSIEQNIDYLKNQKDFYSTIVENQIEELISIEKVISNLRSRIAEEEFELRKLSEEEHRYISLFGSTIKKIAGLENEIKELSKLYSQSELLNKRARDIHTDWHKDKLALDFAKKQESNSISFNRIVQLTDVLKKNMALFGYNNANINYLKISDQTLRPELDGYDIVADSSASDYIRIIWSYTLALMELAYENEDVKHSGFVVFDEPRQHETNKNSFKSLLEKANSLTNSGGQVIIATSIQTEELLSYNLNSKANIRIFEDGEYILQNL
ncbi:AAA domain [Rheinheimera pacifica]|uniref:AAA domain n=1 Tax=Rheinheimera pacifica TaxID=173990 RepID=A0A1H6NMV0_9GAMM|nr:AAA family ATPase [Rheinheimera pacifica]SEI12057.1 AAA domain [Rheinheimera pacifica]